MQNQKGSRGSESSELSKLAILASRILYKKGRELVDQVAGPVIEKKKARERERLSKLVVEHCAQNGGHNYEDFAYRLIECLHMFPKQNPDRSWMHGEVEVWRKCSECAHHTKTIVTADYNPATLGRDWVFLKTKEIEGGNGGE